MAPSKTAIFFRLTISTTHVRTVTGAVKARNILCVSSYSFATFYTNIFQMLLLNLRVDPLARSKNSACHLKVIENHGKPIESSDWDKVMEEMEGDLKAGDCR